MSQPDNKNKASFFASIAGIALIAISAPSQAVVTTTGCANVNVSCTLQELFDGGTVQIDDIEFANFRADFAFADVAVFSTIVVTADDSDPLNVGLLFGALPIIGNASQSLFDFSYSVTAVSTAISLSDASLEVTTGTGVFSVDEDLSDAIDSINPEFQSLTVIDTTPGLTDAVAYTPTDFLYVENFLASDVGASISDFEQYFSLTPVGTGAFQEDANGLLSMEAENFKDNDPGAGPGPFVVVQRPLASEGEAIKADLATSANPGPAGAPFTTYEAAFVVSGPHYAWLRVFGYSLSSDSVFVELPGVAVQTLHFMSTNQWRWRRVDLPFNVAAPETLTLKILRRESSAEVDKIVVTTDPDFNPNTVNDGLGPDESDRAGGGGTTNIAPALDPIPDRTVVEGTSQTISLSATDVDAGDTLAFSATGLPTFTTGTINLIDNGNGTADLVVSPGIGDAGGSFVTITVTDDGLPALTDSKTFLLSIVPPGAGAFLQSDGLVSMEAEHFASNVAAGGAAEWLTLDPVADASNTMAIKASPGGNTFTPGAGSAVTYDVQLQTQPQYVWYRFRSTSSSTDSFFFRFDGDPIVTRYVGPDDGQWHWARLPSAIPVSTPAHTLTIYRREGGLEFDKLVLHTDPGFDPQTIDGGKGPPESARAGGSNIAPVLDPIGLQVLDENEELVLNFSATDANTDDLVLTSVPTSLFGGDTPFFDNTDGTATWTLRPVGGDAGDYPVTVTVTDNGAPNLSDEETFTVRVVDPAAMGAFVQDSVSGLLVAEAENFTLSALADGPAEWLSLAAVPGASNLAAIKAALGPNTSTPGGAFTEYEGVYSVTGPHVVWVRYQAFDKRSDSFFLQLDLGTIQVRHLPIRDGSWRWAKMSSAVPVNAVGNHIIRIYRREPNLVIDKVVVTPDAGFTPTGVGPPESPRL